MKHYLIQLRLQQGACEVTVPLHEAGECAIPGDTGAALEHSDVRRRLGPLTLGERPSTSARVWELHLSPVLSALTGLL